MSLFCRGVEQEVQKNIRHRNIFDWRLATLSTKSASKWSLFTIQRFIQAFLICLPNLQSNCQQGQERF